jgi:hypothetical protein
MARCKHVRRSPLPHLPTRQLRPILLQTLPISAISGQSQANSRPARAQPVARDLYHASKDFLGKIAAVSAGIGRSNSAIHLKTRDLCDIRLSSLFSVLCAGSVQSAKSKELSVTCNPFGRNYLRRFSPQLIANKDPSDKKTSTFALSSPDGRKALLGAPAASPRSLPSVCRRVSKPARSETSAGV